DNTQRDWLRPGGEDKPGRHDELGAASHKHKCHTDNDDFLGLALDELSPTVLSSGSLAAVSGATPRTVFNKVWDRGFGTRNHQPCGCHCFLRLRGHRPMLTCPASESPSGALTIRNKI